MQRYNELLNKKDYEAVPNFRWCSNPKCKAGHIIENGGNGPWYEIRLITDSISFFTCFDCKSKTCFTCSVPWHSGYTCEQYKAGQEEQKHSESRSGAWLNANAKLCGCGRRVQKTSGCDHMTCVCGAEWCYVCGIDYGNIRRQGNRAHLSTCSHYAWQVGSAIMSARVYS